MKIASLAWLAFAATLVWFAAATHTLTQSTDPLVTGFKNPPDSARPRTWWHWTQGNVTKEGITKDLEWMKRSGIAGFQLADVASGSGQEVPNKINFGTPEWFDAVKHAASEAKRLGLEMTIFSSPGWSETGGPWVTPRQGMQRLVWTETIVEGGRNFAGKLEQPPANLGFYADSKVIAFKTPVGEQNIAELKPKVTTSGGNVANVDPAGMLDNSRQTFSTVATGTDGVAWIQFEFGSPIEAQAVTIGARAGRAGVPLGRVMASDDGKTFRTIVSLPGTQLYRQSAYRTYAFPAVTAKFFRIEMTGAPTDPANTMNQLPPPVPREYQVTDAVITTAARVNRFEEKTVNGFIFEYDTVPTPIVAAAKAVATSDVVDLTANMRPDGTFNWNPPAGRWTVLRMGHVPTGARNRPATPLGSGLEADKLSREHMEAYYHGYFDPIEKALGPLFGDSLRMVMMDSWEAGMSNWTDSILGDFQKRRGYDPVPYLPALSGRVVVNANVSDRFLWDYRRTLADLWAENHYGTITELLAKKGIGTYAEAAGVSLEIPEDTLLNKKHVTVPMGEFWVRDLHPRLMYYQDVRGAASAAHVYGKPLVAAESFTGGGYESPFTLKKVADYWVAQGINRLVFHTSAHQPLDTKPGNTMVGTHINRNITWAEQARPLMDYFSRTSFMLQQGSFVADFAYLLNEGAPSTPPIWGAGLQPAVPQGHDFDYINADVLLNRMTVGPDGRLMLPEGMSYRILVLPQSDAMRPELLAKVRELVAGGATVVGPRPARSPSLMGYPQTDNKVAELAAELWGDIDGISRNYHRLGKGQVVWGLPLGDVLKSINLAPDFEYRGALDADVAWIHRRTSDAEIYYVANLSDRPQDLETRFRVAGKSAEIWHPDTGEIQPAAYSTASGKTTVPLHLDERELVFVVFRAPASQPERQVPVVASSVLTTVNGPWDVTFPPNLGAPGRIQLAALAPWSANTDEGVKFFSGTATYSKNIQVQQSWLAGQKVVLDLGAVSDLAEVIVNGRSVGILWKRPYRIDVTSEIRSGANSVQIKVTNEWTNRLAGDRGAPPERRILSGAAAGGRGGGGRGGAAQVPESGLLGPVRLMAEK
jgi:hypothetical protein